MVNDFFNTIKVPDFLQELFTKDDWYLIIANFIKILNKRIIAKTSLDINFNKVSKQRPVLHDKVYIGKNCVIAEYVVVEGPVFIGNNVEIGPGAYIRKGSIICDNCSIGYASEVKNSLMMDGSKVSNHVFLGDSIIGVNARIGGHCETTNRRFDQQKIDFVYRTQKLYTGLNKLGLVLGEGSRLGGGVLTSPGTMIGKNSFVATNSYIDGFVEPNKFIKLVSQYKIVNNNFSSILKNSNLFDKT